MPRKTALCVGINEFAPPPPGGSSPGPLGGCVNDALLIGEMLRLAGFDEVRQLHNDSATQQAILHRLNTRIASLRAGDTFVFWISTHGTQVLDRNGDELVDGMDEAICPYDHDFRNPFIDDKFAQVLARAHPEARIFLGFDACHSGTVTREENDEDAPRARFWAPPGDIAFRSGQAVLDLSDYIEELKAPAGPKLQARKIGLGGKGEMNHLVLSGCQAEQCSWDSSFGEKRTRRHGALTYGFAMAVLESWQQKRPITYSTAFELADKFIQDKQFPTDQSPQLDGPKQLKDAPVFGMEF